MSEFSRSTFFSDGCDHPQVIEDYHEGTTVCTHCGLVLDVIRLPSYRSEKNYDFEKKLNTQGFLENVCEKAGIPHSILEYTAWYATNIENQLKHEKIVKNGIISFALYETLLRFQIPRSPQEISFFTGIPTSTLWFIEKKLSSSVIKSSPQDYVERFTSLLGLDYTHNSTIKTIVSNLYGMGDVRPACLIAVVIHLFCKEKKIKKTVKEICESCGVSSASMYKIMKKMKKEFIEHISLLS